MAKIIPPDHVDDLPVVESNQPDDVLVIPEPVLVDEDEDPKEEEFEEEEEPEEEDDDMKVDIEEDENELELTYPYEEVDPLNPPPLLLIQSPRMDINSFFSRMTSLSRRLCGHETAHALVEKKGKAKDEYYGKLILDLGSEVRSSVEEGTTAMENLTAHALVKKRKSKDEYYGKMILDLGNEVRSSVEEGTTVMENLVRKLGKTEEKAKCKKLKKEMEEARFGNTLLRMQNERVERDLYWTRVRAYEFYREMIRRGFVFEERPNKAIDVSIKDEESSSSGREDHFMTLSSLVSLVVSLLCNH
nr:hypothetical protein [Tanacetum cinerariifolium]